VTVGGKSPKKTKMKGETEESDVYSKIILKGRICEGLPGMISILNPNGALSVPFHCGEACTGQ
jgi:hypothetical protein